MSYTPNKQTGDNKWFNPRKLRTTILEGSRRHHIEARGPKVHHSGPADPLGRPPVLVLGPLILRRLLLLTIYTVDFKAVLGRFIQRWLREVTRIDDVAIPFPLLHLPYIY
jgi:hypothetical protein